MGSPKTVLLDFDATCVMNESPFVGPEVPNCAKVLKRLLRAGHQIILVTMREGHLLDDALEWFANREIKIKYVNSNPEYETGSRKIYGHLIIDDKACGIPLNDQEHKKPFVDWDRVEEILIQKGLI